jgi:uncharacterized protein (TIGR02217 family)
MVQVLNDVLLPESLVEGNIRGTQQRKNMRSANQAGFVKANVLWTTTLRRYEMGFAPMFAADWQAIEGLFEITEGGAFGFLMRDPKDGLVSDDQGLLMPYASAEVGALGVGYGVPSYRLYKRYAVAGSTRTKDRRITRPDAVSVLRGVSPVTEGAGAGQISIDDDVGLVTFVADATSAAVSITVGATTQVELTGAIAGMTAGKRLYLSGFSGADGAGRSRARTSGRLRLHVGRSGSGHRRDHVQGRDGVRSFGDRKRHLGRSRTSRSAAFSTATPSPKPTSWTVGGTRRKWKSSSATTRTCRRAR